jgi:peptidoglycan hydrolase-like protein with peptidoglycan-binding domain
MSQVQTPTLSAAVGQSSRTSKGPQPKNNSSDVQLVQEMLNEAGFKVATNGRYDDKLGEAIKQFQQKVLKLNNPDGVVDVNQKTFKKLAEIAAKSSGGEASAESKEKFYEFKFQGKTYTLNEEDYKAALAETAKRLMRVVDALTFQCDTLESVQNDMRKSLEGGEGLMESIVFFTSAKWAGLDIPEFKNQDKARSAISKARIAVKKSDLEGAPQLIKEANASVQAFDKELGQYRNKLIGGAESITKGLEITRDTSFAVAETIATAELIASGTNPKVAKTSAAAFFTALKSGATEVGEHLADPKKGWSDSAQKVLVDTLVKTATSVIANGFKGESIEKWAGSLAPKIANVPPFKQLGKDAAAKFIEKALKEGGQRIAKDGMSELIKAFGESAKKGRVPTIAEVKQQMLDYISGELTGTVLKKFDSANWKAMRSFEDSFVEKRADVLGTWFAGLGKAQRAKILMDICKKLEEPIIQKMGGAVVDKVSFSASENEIAKVALDASLDDKKLIEMIKKEIEKQQKKAK